MKLPIPSEKLDKNPRVQKLQYKEWLKDLYSKHNKYKKLWVPPEK